MRVWLPLVLSLVSCVNPEPPRPKLASANVEAPKQPSARTLVFNHKAPAVHVEWLALTLPSRTAAAAINQSLENRAVAAAKEFIADAQKAKGEERDLGGLPGADSWELRITCRTALLRATLVSIRCEDYRYQGGAHGMESASSRNFAVEADVARELSLADILVPPFIERIDKYVMNELRAREADWVLDGSLTTVAELLHTWNVTREGLSFAFDPYEVGSYAQGPHEVLVPFAVLSPVIRRPGPLDVVSPP